MTATITWAGRARMTDADRLAWLNAYRDVAALLGSWPFEPMCPNASFVARLLRDAADRLEEED